MPGFAGLRRPAPRTGAAPTGDTTSPRGLNVADDGTVFFTSVEALVLRDTNKQKDAYEWEDGAGRS